MGNTTYSMKGIKGKLVAATCMLLVSCIMVVSSTYAWFTLSTAPEVTGIQTAVGANGNLEMALLPLTGNVTEITSSTNDSGKALIEKNVTWGNLVALKDDLNEDPYGMSQIVLYPAALNVPEGQIDEYGNPLKIDDTILKTPTYGADGRVSELVANTMTGTFDSATQKFPSSADGQESYGVRAVGAASGMSDRQLAYRNLRSAANNAISNAKTAASRSLNVNGVSLANIAMKKATGSDTTTYTQEEVASLLAIVNDLVGTEGTDGVFDYIETAYIKYIQAYIASAQSNMPTDETAMSAITTTNGMSLTELMDYCDEKNYDVPDEISSVQSALAASISTVETAKAELKALQDDGDAITWTAISTPLYKLANIDAMKINGIIVTEVKNETNLNQLINDVMGGKGIVVSIASGGGVYADVADHCGDFTASITLTGVSYNGLVLDQMTARMETVGVKPAKLTVVSEVVERAGAPASGSGESRAITDMYGYIIDLAFRTNAADSKLLLQTTPVDRIYDGNDNADTQGHGSTMTFTATSNDFTATQVAGLMKAIRIVFFDSSKSVLATAKLAEPTTSADGMSATADIVIYKNTAGGEDVQTGENHEIMALPQNTGVAVSVLVYLDGNLVGNDDVAATAATSMTGTMNLQFASSAELEPMEYAQLHTNQGSGNDEGDDEGTDQGTEEPTTPPAEDGGEEGDEPSGEQTTE